MTEQHPQCFDANESVIVRASRGRTQDLFTTLSVLRKGMWEYLVRIPGVGQLSQACLDPYQATLNFFDLNRVLAKDVLEDGAEGETFIRTRRRKLKLIDECRVSNTG